MHPAFPNFSPALCLSAISWKSSEPPFIYLMIALSPKLCFQQVKHQNNLGIIKTAHRPPRNLLSVLSPFGQTVHLSLVPRLVEGLDRLNIHVHLCWSRSFIFFSFEYCGLSLGSCTDAPGHHLSQFFQEEKCVDDAQHSSTLSRALR